MGRVRLWSEDAEYTYWFDDPAFVDVVGWGRLSRLEIGRGRASELGFLDREESTLSLLPRSQDTLLNGEVAFDGLTVHLSEAPAVMLSGLHQFVAVMMQALFDTGMTGGRMTVSPGAWGNKTSVDADEPRDSRWIACEVHRRSDWDEHISITTGSPPAGADVWSAAVDPSAEGGDRAVVPLHGSGLQRAVGLIAAVAGDWQLSPDQLMLSFETATDLI